MIEEIDLNQLSNRRILIVDDNKSIHRDYKAVLCPDENDEAESKLGELEDVLFGETSDAGRQSASRNFELTSAYQGKDALKIVEDLKKEDTRIPMAFVDMRMPPGWDGLETIERLREIDPEMLFMIVTAYSDHTFDTIIERLGRAVPVRILYKPFNPEEIYQSAYQMVASWNEKNSAS